MSLERIAADPSRDDAASSFSSRRRLLGQGVIGAAAAFATAQAARADLAKPIASAPDALHPNGRFRGRVVLITGATSGIGEATARAFVMWLASDEGSFITGCDIDVTSGQMAA